MKKILLALLLISCLAEITAAQDFSFGQITDAELNMKKYDKDTSAHAVVLREFGKARIDLANDDAIKVFYEYHVKIKIFDAKGFDKGLVEIPLRTGSDQSRNEEVDDVSGVTWYRGDNGSMQKAELEHHKIYPEKTNKYWSSYKFALPGLRNGCVIEYKYRVESPRWDIIPSWHFQDDIPKVYSEYEVHIPGFWAFNASLKGSLKLSKSSAEIEQRCFSASGATADCSRLVYAMSDIPAFVEEDYMTSKKNFLSAINFELQEYANPFTGVKGKWTKEWKDIDYQLKDEQFFGGQIKRKNVFKDRIVPVIAGKAGDLEKAKAVYEYIQKLFKWDDFIGIYSEDGIHKAVEAHSGSAADINLSLVNALNAAGLNAEAVLLSTRDNGMLNTLYPVLSDFNYVIAKVNIGDKSYLLDATDPLLSFGLLPLKCLNDKGRAFSLDKPSYWVDLTLPQKQKSTLALDLTLQEDGKIKGALTKFSSGYEAYTKRKAIKKFNTVDEYVDDFAGKLPKLKILKSEIINLDSLDLPLGEKYEIEMDTHDKMKTDRIAFNPFFLDRIDTNPFKLASRSFPVDMGMASDDRLILTMHLPAQYTVEAPPQLMSVRLPDNGGEFLTGYEAGENSFTFSDVLQFNKKVYGAEEYANLKEIFNRVIQFEKADMVFRKK